MGSRGKQARVQLPARGNRNQRSEAVRSGSGGRCDVCHCKEGRFLSERRQKVCKRKVCIVCSCLHYFFTHVFSFPFLRGGVLDHWLLSARDVFTYGLGSFGGVSGPTFEQLYQKGYKKKWGAYWDGDLTKDTLLDKKICSGIKESSLRTNHWYNQRYDTKSQTSK